MHPMVFGATVGDLFYKQVPDQYAIGVARGSILTARRLGLIEERDGMIVPSEALLRTKPWWTT